MIRGFIVLYLLECTLSLWCNETVYLTDKEGKLTSPTPQGSLLYPDNTRCSWNITIPREQLRVQLSFDHFYMEDCSHCSCDYVEVMDVIDSRQISLGKFCGRQNPGPFFSSQQTLFVVFQSDHGDSSIGFRASYSAVLPASVCRNVTRLFTTTGNIHSPEFPIRRYPNKQECIWQITSPPRTRLTLKTLSLQIQNCSRKGEPFACSCDYIEIRDGDSANDRLLARLCGFNIPDVLYSSGRHLWVRFVSDDSETYSGFAANFASSTIDNYSCPASWKYPIKCPEWVNVNTNKTQACCYDNGPSCCEPGGNRCSDKGSDVRDYCPRPDDDKKLVHCCMKGEQPSCCCSRGPFLTASYYRVLPWLFGTMVWLLNL